MSVRDQATVGGNGFSEASPIAALPSERLLKLVYFFGIPFVLGSLIGWGRVGPVAGALPRELAMFYWGAISLLLWNAKFLLGWLGVRTGLLSARPTLLSLTMIACFAEVLLRPIHRGIVLGLAPALEVTELPFNTLLPGSLYEMGAALIGHGPLIAVWALATVFYVRGLGLDLFAPKPAELAYRSAPAVPAAPVALADPTEPSDFVAPRAPSKNNAGLLEKLPAGHGPIRALRALDHYVQVYLDEARPMFIHRFDDAAREVGSLGLLRIHRSFCVHPAAIAGLESRGRRKFVVLESGEKLPVSATYLDAVLAARADLRR